MILDPNKSYTFVEIFDLPASTEEILADLGYTYRTAKLELRHRDVDKDAIDQLQAKFYRRLPHISFGEVWRFGLIDRNKQTVTRDLDGFFVPTGLYDLIEALAGLAST